MAVYLPLKMKRKELEEVNDDFSDFSLSSPARKIRRLDAELPPIMEEEEPEVPLVFEQSMPQEQLSSNMEQVGGLAIEEFPSVPVNEERAVVLFKPMNTPLLQSPSNFSLRVNSDIISGFKNQVLCSSQSNGVKSVDQEAARRGYSSGATNGCLAVVPWIPSQLPSTPAEIPQTEVTELMEAEEMDATTMDIEDNDVSVDQGQGNQFSGMSVSEGLHQWQQQHCMIPQLPQNTSTPIVWFR